MFKVEVKSERDEDVCVLIKVANHSYNYIVDCGEAKALGVKECQNTNALFLSHTHIDHFVNFDTLLRHQIGIGRKVVICGPEGITGQVQNRIKSYCWNLISEGAITYEIREIQNNGKIKSVTLRPPLWEQENEHDFSNKILFQEKEFEVDYEILDHKTNSIAYLFAGYDKTKIELNGEFRGGKWVAELKKSFENQDSDAIISIEGKEHVAKDLFHLINTEKGERLGIILDHAASQENHEKIKTKFWQCDQVLIECFYKDEDKEFAEKNYHSYASMSGKIMRESEVKKVTPIHFSRKYNAEEIELLITQFESAFHTTNN